MGNDTRDLSGLVVELFPNSPQEPMRQLLVQQKSPHLTVAEMGHILEKAGDLFERGGVVRIGRDPESGALRATQLSAESLVKRVHQLCRPVAIKKGEREEARLPTAMARMYLDDHGQRGLKPLTGFVTSPLLRPDGEILCEPGYDAGTGLFVDEVPDCLSLVPARPTREEAEVALLRLRSHFASFCFADGVKVTGADGIPRINLEEAPGADESAYLVALLTAVCRASVKHAPGLLVTAPTGSGAGTGKGLLTRCLTIIANGHEPSPITGGRNREELDKAISAEFIAGGDVVYIDNLNGFQLRSNQIASALTEARARIRILGASKTVMVNTRALVVINGNGLLVAEDLVRRFIEINLDAGVEDPESRSFLNDVLAETYEKRMTLLAAALTIWRWGRHQANLPAGRPLGSFGEWARWVRDPLLALGCADPVVRIATAKQQDTTRLAHKEVLEAWWKAHGDAPMRTADLAEPVKAAMALKEPTRQAVNGRVNGLINTRIGGYHLRRHPSPSKTGTATYSVVKEEEEDEKHPDHPDHQAVKAPGICAAEEHHSATPMVGMVGMHFEPSAALSTPDDDIVEEDLT